MPVFASERKKIARIKERINGERAQLDLEAGQLLPQASKVAAIGTVAWSLRKFGPFLRPLAIGLAQRAISRKGRSRLLKVAGLLGAGFAVWRLLDDDD